MKQFVLALVLITLPAISAIAGNTVKPVPLHNGAIKVAFVVSKAVTPIDIVGPWQVFEDTSVKNAAGDDVAPYELYTVAPGKSSVRTDGANHPGLMITPDYDFSDAPTPDIVVLGAQDGGPGLSAWLKKLHAEHKTIMSVCTGAFLLAKTGLLDGKEATTHHWFFGNFSREFPKVRLVKEVRYVQASPTLYSSGGETSGIDLALHLVAQRFGQKTAQSTANFMEYQGTGWKTNKGISVATTPVTRETWSGQFAPGDSLVLHIIKHGASPSFRTDIPSLHVVAAPTTVTGNGGKNAITVQVQGHTITFTGTANAKGTAVSGTYTQDGKSYPLTLERKAQPQA